MRKPGERKTITTLGFRGKSGHRILSPARAGVRSTTSDASRHCRALKCDKNVAEAVGRESPALVQPFGSKCSDKLAAGSTNRASSSFAPYFFSFRSTIFGKKKYPGAAIRSASTFGPDLAYYRILTSRQPFRRGTGFQTSTNSINLPNVADFGYMTLAAIAASVAVAATAAAVAKFTAVLRFTPDTARYKMVPI